MGNAWITHHGYADDVVQERDKLDRNLRIARESYAADPTESHAVHLIRSLKAASTDPDATLAEIEPLLDEISSTDVTIRAMITAVRAELLMDAGRLEAAATAAAEALETVPADDIAGAILAESLVRLGRPGEALERDADYRSRPSPESVFADRLAGFSRAHALFDAAVSVGDADAAVGYLDHLAGDVDPWLPFVEAFGTAMLGELAARAGAAGDGRYVRALVARDDVTAMQLETARDEFTNAGGVQRDVALLETAIAEVSEVDDAPSRRAHSSHRALSNMPSRTRRRLLSDSWTCVKHSTRSRRERTQSPRHSGWPRKRSRAAVSATKRSSTRMRHLSSGLLSLERPPSLSIASFRLATPRGLSAPSRSQSQTRLSHARAATSS